MNYLSLIITTKNDLQKIIINGCLECGTKEKFIYYSSTKSYACYSCNSNYVIDTESLLNLLYKIKEDNVRFYRNSAFPDDDKQDFVGKIKIRKKNHILTTKTSEK